MSIYPVRIKTWYPPSERTEENIGHRQTIRIVLMYEPCAHCGKKVKMRNGWCFHALPYGYGGEVWCTKYRLKAYWE